MNLPVEVPVDVLPPRANEPDGNPADVPETGRDATAVPR